ncbi:hypothetical protein L1987_61160 [Smallanthus sonchifolius]|uniref:Uncharacterized protein n=1 Tax=Smallanthus sonchifolius TaxID=185202 RepID=A0ACB9DAD8_9ASTR|nr:hypothetical protein L1987_61160 [Smallanthus sonchifolius]
MFPIVSPLRRSMFMGFEDLEAVNKEKSTENGFFCRISSLLWFAENDECNGDEEHQTLPIFQKIEKLSNKVMQWNETYLHYHKVDPKQTY